MAKPEWKEWEEIEEIEKLANLVIGCAITVAKELRPGYLERVYENALFHELRKNGLAVEKQVYMDVFYDGVMVGQFVADMVVSGELMLELKAVSDITSAHIAQALNYLTTTDNRLCLILNFGTPKLGIKRVRN